MHPEEYARIYEAEEEHWWYRGLREMVLAALRRHVAYERVERGDARDRPAVLDAGCGTGGMAAALQAVATVTPMDVSPVALQYCRRRGLARLVAGSVTAVPFGDARFDVVVSLDVLYHAAVADDQQAARELARVLRPGGVLILNLPAYDWLRGPHDVVIRTARRYTRGQVRRLLEGAGLQVVATSHWNTLLFPAAALVRLMGRRFGRQAEGRSDIGAVHPLMNRALSAVLAFERLLLRRVRLPFGLSVIAVGRRPLK